MGYCGIMLNNITVFTSDKYWNLIFADLGAIVTESSNVADVVFDDIDINAPISVAELKNIIFNRFNNTDVIQRVLGADVVLSDLQRRLVGLLYKNPGMTMAEMRAALGVSPDVTSHVVENAVYQLRKKYGRELIVNENGKYKIGRV